MGFPQEQIEQKPQRAYSCAFVESILSRALTALKESCSGDVALILTSSICIKATIMELFRSTMLNVSATLDKATSAGG